MLPWPLMLVIIPHYRYSIVQQTCLLELPRTTNAPQREELCDICWHVPNSSMWWGAFVSQRRRVTQTLTWSCRGRGLRLARLLRSLESLVEESRRTIYSLERLKRRITLCLSCQTLPVCESSLYAVSHFHALSSPPSIFFLIAVYENLSSVPVDSLHDIHPVSILQHYKFKNWRCYKSFNGKLQV